MSPQPPARHCSFAADHCLAVSSCRNLFTRALARKQSQKKAKSLFKKWMEIERRLAAPGDDSGPEMVKAKAIAFVQGQSAGADEGDYEEME